MNRQRDKLSPWVPTVLRVRSEDQLTCIQQKTLPGNNTTKSMFCICTTSKNVTNLAKEKSCGNANALKNNFVVIQN